MHSGLHWGCRNLGDILYIGILSLSEKKPFSIILKESEKGWGNKGISTKKLRLNKTLSGLLDEIEADSIFQC